MRRLTFLLAVSVTLAGLICNTAQAQGIYNNLHEFAGGASDGRLPYGSLTLNGSTLYGMARYGGTNDNGVILACRLSGPNYSEYLHESTFDGDFPQQERWIFSSQ